MSYKPLPYASIEAPLSTQEISERASDFDYDSSIPLKHWLRTTLILLREADIYDREGNDEQAYLLLVRHANLVLEHLPRHPEAHRPEYQRNFASLRKRIPEILERLEVLKPRINKRYEDYRADQAAQRRQHRAKEFELQQRHQILQRSGSISSRSRTDSLASSPGSTNYSIRDHGHIEESKYAPVRPKLRKNDSDRRGSNAGSASTSIYSSQDHFDRHGWSYEPETPVEEKRTLRQSRNDDLDLQRSLQTLHLQSETPIPPYLQMGLQESARHRPSTTRKTSYPSVPRNKNAGNLTRNEDYSSFDFETPAPRPRPERVPTLPPKVREPDKNEYCDDMSYMAPRMPLPPPKPIKIPASSPPQHQYLPVPGQSESRPAVTSSSSYQFQNVAYTEGGQALRTIFLPEGLRSKFLSMAGPNTRKNLETCGILCGFLKQNALFINRLVIPDQEATSDTCATTDEEALFNYVDGEDLMVLGWIHTHPTQTCFMSSVDLHTHCSYQLMLTESIAIVCAPSQEPSWGIFRLTDPSGIKTITSCRDKGLFHPHSGEIYTDALRPGHVCEVKDMGFGVVDLRSKIPR